MPTDSDPKAFTPTPGSWRAECDSTSDERGYRYWQILSDEGNWRHAWHIAQCWEGLEGEQSKANAYLIAAAPVMLALLREVKTQHQRILAGEDRAFGLNLGKRIGEAIAKAEGREG